MSTTEEFDFELRKLSDLFFNAYPKSLYREILIKNTRAYNCILFQTHYDYFVCVPYRSEISHKYAYTFNTSDRSKNAKYKSGLDYTKMVIIKNLDYISNETAIIDDDEYVETVQNIERIKEGALNYLNSYIDHLNGKKKLHPREFSRRFDLSSLPYFHPELGLP